MINVVDLSGPAPWDELRMLKEELEKCKPGMSARARMVIANKAGLLGGDGNPEEVRLARADKDDLALDVVPTSAKYSQKFTRRST